MKKKKGFTLLEIMIVVTVIGILMAIGIPSVRAAHNRGAGKTKESNVRILNHAVQMWSIETLQPDDTTIKSEFLDYIQGGLEKLTVGAQVVDLDVITSKTVTYKFTVEDIY